MFLIRRSMIFWQVCGGGGPSVNMLAFYSANSSSNPARGDSIFAFEKNEYERKVAGFGPHLQKNMFFKNGPTPGLFSFIFGLFKQTSIQFLQQINVEKCQFHPVYGTGIQTHDLSIMSHLP